ncbi:hypothetical protein [Levilactobacillus zymae]|uniref:Phage protein n=1 Tax=Levilactobacillus zymae TaxID=267363 RepID=A0A1Y6JYE7_9LACO|nr:hypothetical protein [Levilactobacillus zymae]QFR60084.1 hypothetical protein LZ395_00360 [Levilactobacillus zymae]GEO71480.1 hypothetical protein LZY01_06480 [Levilactobacillus zymae]SMS14938.1 hypothetical protein LZ3411_1888 [Levilactobacillus zymae]
MNEKQIQRLCQVVGPKYGLNLTHEGLVITSVNGEPTSFDASQYMPDQFIDFLTKIIGTKMKADLWDWQ